MSFDDEESVDRFVQRFISRTLPKAGWTHEAQLVVGLWHVLHHRAEALSLLRQRIRAYNEAVGTPNTDDSGYHETLTAFFVEALRIYSDAGSSRDRCELFNSLGASHLSDRLIPLAFYGRASLLAVESRHTYVEPELQPLSRLSLLFPTTAMPSPSFHLRPADRPDAEALLQLVIALAEFEKLDPPDEAAQARLIEDAFGKKPRFEPWLALVEGQREPVGYAIFLETYSSFLALPTLYIEDVFVLPEYRKQGIGGGLLRKAVELAHQRGCGRVEWTALDWNVNAQQVYEQRLGARRMSDWFLYRMTRDDMDHYLQN